MIFWPLLSVSALILDAPAIQEEVKQTKAWADWRQCINTGAKALSHAPDSADLIADADLDLCWETELHVREAAYNLNPTNAWTQEVMDELRAEMRRYAMTEAIRDRAKRSLNGE